MGIAETAAAGLMVLVLAFEPIGCCAPQAGWEPACSSAGPRMDSGTGPRCGSGIVVLEMDDLDRAILRILKDNARESFVNMANVLGTSEGTVRARVKRLTDDGIIHKFTVQTAGANVKAMIEVRIETNVNTSAVSSEIAKWEGVERVFEVTGEHDIVVVADVSSTGDLNDIVERIRQFKETQSTRSRLILKEY